MTGLLERFPDLPRLVVEHWQLSATALMLGSLSAAIISWLGLRYQRLQYPLLTVVGLVQTIPGLALLALAVASLAMLNEAVPQWSISSLGFLPAITALTLYSMLPIVRNSITGIRNVDPALTEAARGLGMTSNQILARVELPLALPVIVAGFRTATVWTVGAATLATPVGQSCLGNYIFTGLHIRDWTMVLVGCVAAAVMAIALDTSLGALQHAVERRARWRSRGIGLSLAVLFLCGAAMSIRPAAATVDLNSSGSAGTPRTAPDDTGRLPPLTVRIGAKTFTEQYILAELISQRLKAQQLEVAHVDGLGSSVILEGLINGDIDVYVDYSGTLWANAMQRQESAPGWRVLAEVSGWLSSRHQVRCLGPLGFENAYALAVRGSDVERLQLNSIADLKPHAGQMKIAGDYEFFGRPEWQAVREAYALEFGEQVSLDSTFMYEALKNSEVDVISAFSSDGRIAAFDLRVLRDPQQAIPPYDALLLLSKRVADDPRVLSALEPLVEAIPVELMRQANLRVDRDEDKFTVPAAAEWLLDAIDLTPATAAE